MTRSSPPIRIDFVLISDIDFSLKCGGPRADRVSRRWAKPSGAVEGQATVFVRKIFEARAELARRGHLTPKEPPGPDWIPEGVRPV